MIRFTRAFEEAEFDQFHNGPGVRTAILIAYCSTYLTQTHPKAVVVPAIVGRLENRKYHTSSEAGVTPRHAFQDATRRHDEIATVLWLLRALPHALASYAESVLDQIRRPQSLPTNAVEPGSVTAIDACNDQARLTVTQAVDTSAEVVAQG